MPQRLTVRYSHQAGPRMTTRELMKRGRQRQKQYPLLLDPEHARWNIPSCCLNAMKMKTMTMRP